MDSASLFRVADGTDAPLSPSISPHASMLDHQGTEESTLMLATAVSQNGHPASSHHPLATHQFHQEQQQYEHGNKHSEQHHVEHQQPLQDSLEDVAGNSYRQSAGSQQQERTQQMLQPQFPSYLMLPPNTEAMNASKRPMAPPPPLVAEQKRRRLCKFPNCNRVVKSQGHCQRHGAKPKRCKVPDCDKQAQGTHDGMCKRHWRDATMPKGVDPNKTKVPPEPTGVSAYDAILPQSIAYKPPPPNVIANMPSDAPLPEGAIMPLVDHLRQGMTHKEFGWHREEERKARGVVPLKSLSTQFETWERQLVLVEILLLSGGTPYANFRDLAHAWGRDKGFHTTLALNVFERRGDIERKKRSDHGKTLTAAQKAGLRAKWKQRKSSKTTTTPTYCQAVASPPATDLPIAPNHTYPGATMDMVGEELSDNLHPESHNQEPKL